MQTIQTRTIVGQMNEGLNVHDLSNTDHGDLCFRLSMIAPPGDERSSTQTYP